MISASDWQRYIFKLAKINQKAAELMQQWMEQHGASDFLAIVNYAYALISKYGESSAAWACERYDALPRRRTVRFRQLCQQQRRPIARWLSLWAER